MVEGDSLTWDKTFPNPLGGPCRLALKFFALVKLLHRRDSGRHGKCTISKISEVEIEGQW